MNNLELRMYGLVPYNISPIQQAIQFGHAVVEYGIPYLDDRHQLPAPGREDYLNWAKYWKTFIILNGGTSNHSESRYENPFIEDPSEISDRISPVYMGSMEKNYKELLSRGIRVGVFYEPDLNDMLSAVVFLVDERVFNREKYPDFKIGIKDPTSKKGKFYKENPLKVSNFPGEMNFYDISDAKSFDMWKESIGGSQNLFLREFLKNFRLA